MIELQSIGQINLIPFGCALLAFILNGFVLSIIKWSEEKPVKSEKLTLYKKNPQIHKHIAEYLEQGHVITNKDLKEIKDDYDKEIKKAKEQIRKTKELEKHQRILNEQKSFFENS